MNRLRKLGEDVTIGGQEYCVRGGFAFPGRCEVQTVDTNPPAPVAFGPFGLPVSPELAVALEESPTVGPSITPDPVTINPDVPIPEESIWDRLVRYSSRVGNALVPDRFAGLRLFVAFAIPGGLLLLLALWILKRTRR